MRKLIIILIRTIGFTSCEPDMCTDCYTVTYEDGTKEKICVEYDCSYEYIPEY